MYISFETTEWGKYSKHDLHKTPYWLLMKSWDEISFSVCLEGCMKNLALFGIRGSGLREVRTSIFQFLACWRQKTRKLRVSCAASLFAFYFIKSILVKGPNSMNYIVVICFLRQKWTFSFTYSCEWNFYCSVISEGQKAWINTNYSTVL